MPGDGLEIYDGPIVTTFDSAMSRKRSVICISNCRNFTTAKLQTITYSPLRKRDCAVRYYADGCSGNLLI